MGFIEDQKKKELKQKERGALITLQILITSKHSVKTKIIRRAEIINRFK